MVRQKYDWFYSEQLVFAFSINNYLTLVVAAAKNRQRIAAIYHADAGLQYR